MTDKLDDLDPDLALALGVSEALPRKDLLRYAISLADAGALLFHAAKTGQGVRVNLDTHKLEVIDPKESA